MTKQKKLIIFLYLFSFFSLCQYKKRKTNNTCSQLKKTSEHFITYIMASLPLGLLAAPSGIPCQRYYYNPGNTLPRGTIWAPSIFLATYNGDGLNVQLACEAVCCSPGCPRMLNWYHTDIPFEVLSLFFNQEGVNFEDLWSEDGLLYTGDRWGGWKCGSCEILSVADPMQAMTDPANQFKVEMMGHVPGFVAHLGKRLNREAVERDMDDMGLRSLPDYVSTIVDRQQTMFEKSGFKRAAWHWHRYQSVLKDINLSRQAVMGGAVPEGYTRFPGRFISDMQDMNPSKYAFPFYGGWNTFHCMDTVPISLFLPCFTREEAAALAAVVREKISDMRNVFALCAHGPRTASEMTSKAEIQARGLDPFRELVAGFVLPPLHMRDFIFELSDELRRRFGIDPLASILPVPSVSGAAVEPVTKKSKTRF
jgi:hypothetical protein